MTFSLLKRGIVFKEVQPENIKDIVETLEVSKKGIEDKEAH
jgi:hypothetical protein